MATGQNFKIDSDCIVRLLNPAELVQNPVKLLRNLAKLLQNHVEQLEFIQFRNSQHYFENDKTEVGACKKIGKMGIDLSYLCCNERCNFKTNAFSFMEKHLDHYYMFQDITLNPGHSATFVPSSTYSTF